MSLACYRPWGHKDRHDLTEKQQQIKRSFLEKRLSEADDNSLTTLITLLYDNLISVLVRLKKKIGIFKMGVQSTTRAHL